MEQPLSSQAVSGTNTYYSPWVFIDGDRVCSAFFEWDFSGTMAGTLTVETTTAPRADVSAGVYGIGPTKYDKGDYATDQAISGAKTDFFEVAGLSCTAVRLKYVNASGTGTWTTRARANRSA